MAKIDLLYADVAGWRMKPATPIGRRRMRRDLRHERSSAPHRLAAASGPCPATLCVKLALLDERRFANGMVYLRYRAQP